MLTRDTAANVKPPDVTVRCNIDLPRYAIEAIDREAKRAGMQRATFLRFIILRWIEKERRSGVYV